MATDAAAVGFKSGAGWVVTSAGPGHFYYPTVATDQAGNIYVAGSSWGKNDIGKFKITHTKRSLYVLKLSPTGVVIELMTFPAGSYGDIHAIAIGKQGTIYLGGDFTESVSFGSVTLKTNDPSKTTKEDMFLAALEPSGKVKWAWSAGAVNEREYVESIALDSADNLMVSGAFSTKITLGTNTLKVAENEVLGDPFIARVNPSGKIIWATTCQHAADGASVTMGPADSIYIRGGLRFESYNEPVTAPFAQCGKFKMSLAARYRYPSWVAYGDFVASMDKAGNFLWANKVSAKDSLAGFAVDPAGYGFLTAPGNLSKLSPSGKALWTRKYCLNKGTYLYSHHIVRSAAGAMFVSGQFQHSQDFLLCQGKAVGNHRGFYVQKVSLQGKLLWSGAVGNSNAYPKTGGMIHANGRLIVAGIYDSAFTLAGHHLSHPTTGDQLFVWSYPAP